MRYEVVAWLAAAGFEEIQIQPTPAPTQLLVTGTVPG